jgi:hypothetical protein
MSTDSQNIIAGFDALPQGEQREVLAALLQKSVYWDTPALADEDLLRLADERFLELDRREAMDGA